MGKIVDFVRIRVKITPNTEKTVPKTMERCVFCGSMTEVASDVPIQNRKCYVPGGGQLCRDCCIRLYHTDDLRTLDSSDFEDLF